MLMGCLRGRVRLVVVVVVVVMTGVLVRMLGSIGLGRRIVGIRGGGLFEL
jgi:hypothetical protein